MRMEHEDDIKEALDFVSPSALTYEEWLMVGMGLKEAGLPVAVWEQWSARDGGRYHKGECIKKWESFHGSSKPVTQSSIFQLAYEHGWSGPAGHALDWGDELTVGPQQPALVDPRWVEEQELHLPDTWEPAQQLKRYLQALFEPDEYVAYVTESFMAADRRRPAKGCWDRTAGQLIKELDACGGDVGKVMGDCDPEIGASPQPSPRPSTSSSSGPRHPRKARIEMKKKISAGTLTRTAVLGLALTNQLLSAAGKPLLPIDNAQLEQMISTGFTVGAALAAWWKNNSFTAAAIEGDKRMNSLKNQVH